MKKTVVTVFLALILLVTCSLPAVAAGNGNAVQAQEQNQNRVQTEVENEDREASKLRLEERLQIREEAKLQKQERVEARKQTGAEFADTDAHWAKEQIGLAYAWGLVSGYPDGTFSPDSDISGTEGVLMMSRLMDAVSGEADLPGKSDEIAWERVPEWAKEHMQNASALRIMAQSKLYGAEKLNRLQFAVMLAKADDLEPEAVADETVLFLDQQDIPEADLGYLSALRTLGIIEGDNGSFDAERKVSRAEAAAMLTRILDILDPVTETETAV